MKNKELSLRDELTKDGVDNYIPTKEEILNMMTWREDDERDEFTGYCE